MTSSSVNEFSDDDQFHAGRSRVVDGIRRGEPISERDLVADSRLRNELLLVGLIEQNKLPGCPTESVEPFTCAGYELGRLVGSGGMGAVYEAHQESLNRRVAIKILTRPPEQKNLGQRFHIEAKTTSELNHPNIVSAFDYGIDGDRPWLAMPFVEGVTLDEILESPEELASLSSVCSSSELHAQWIARLGSQVAGALAHAHENGIVHRDIKPGNLILDAEGKVWVTDFGLAKIRDVDTDLSKTGVMIGTPTYMAPEQVRGIVDPRSDIYSLGVTLWELCGNSVRDGVRGKPSTNNTCWISNSTAFA